jgi:catechol 2,3-dioxygenase-like lactoylglutathione lyase family enzyme
MYYCVISSEALEDPLLLNDYRPLKVTVDHKPQSDHPYWHRYLYAFTDAEVREMSELFASHMKDGWYAVAWDRETVYVMLKQEIFELKREQQWQSAEYQKMRQYALTHGVEEEYLDFNERFAYYDQLVAHRRIQHVALGVKDMQQSVQWYQDMLGFEKLHDYQQNDMQIAHLELDDVRLELFCFSNMKALTPKDLMDDLHTVGTRHLSIELDHLDDTIAKLKQKGVEFATELDTAYWGGRFIFVRDCNGILIELYGQ